MGQCPMMPEPVYGCYQEEEGLVFLVPHRHDLSMRCLLDPGQVYEILLLQAEILSRRLEQQYRQEQQEGSLLPEISQKNDIEKVASDEYAVSTFAPSVYTDAGKTEVTTFSVATRVAGNFDKYSYPKRRQGRVNRSKLPQKHDLSPQHRNSKDLHRVMESSGETSSFSSSVVKPSTKCTSKGDSSSLAPEGGCVPKATPAIGSVFSPCSGSKASGTKARFAKDEFYNVLQLKMKLNLADYYQNEYLTVFPQSPTPDGMLEKSCTCSPIKPDVAPQLTRISSDASSRSSATPGVAFGSGISSFPVRLLVDGSSFLDLAVSGSLGLVERARTEGNSLSESPSRQKSPSHYIVLINQRSGIPLAVCALKSHHGPPVVRVYATKQRVVGQRPAASTGDLGLTWTDSYPLFAWAEFTTEGEFPLPTRYNIFMASGSDGRFEKEPSYRASHLQTGSPDIAVVGRTQTETDYSGCALLSIYSNDSSDTEPFLSLDISRGIDPALMICFAAIVDETIEKTMRLRCAANSRKSFQRGRSR